MAQGIENHRVKIWFLFLGSHYMMGKMQQLEDWNLSWYLLLKLQSRTIQEFEEILLKFFSKSPQPSNFLLASKMLKLQDCIFLTIAKKIISQQ